MTNKYICCFGEVLWDDFPTGRLPGGAPMNVAIGLQNLGVSANMISCVGNDELGKELKAFLQSRNCITDWVQIDETHCTGIVKVQASVTGENHYEIVQPSAWDYIQYSKSLADFVENSYAIVYGTLACRQSNNLGTLLQLLEKAKLKVYDVNFRSPFYDTKLVETLLHQADIVKMNDEELEIICQWYDLSFDDEVSKLLFLRKQFGLQKLIITKGANGAICLDDDGFFQSAGVKVQVQDTVGSGDAFLAGFLYKIYQGASSGVALTFACALGALVASHKGANPNIELEELMTILAQTNEIS